MNCRGPPKNVYKNNRIQKLALPSIQSENIRDGQALSKHKLIKAVIDQVHNKRNAGGENSNPKKTKKAFLPRSHNKNFQTEKNTAAASTPTDIVPRVMNKLVCEGSKNYKIVLSSSDIRQQGIFGVRSRSQYFRRKYQRSPVSKLNAAITEQIVDACGTAETPVYRDPSTAQDNEYKWLKGFSCTVDLQSKEAKDIDIDVDDDFLRDVVSVLSATFEEIIEECPPFKTGTKSFLMEKLDVYVRRQAGEESEADDTSGTYLTEYLQLSSQLPQGSEDRSSSRFDARYPPNSLAAELSTSTLSTTRPRHIVSSPNWKPLQSQPMKRPDVFGHPVFQPEEGRQEVSNHFVPRFDREYCTPEPAMQGCNKRLQRGSLECLPRANRDYTRQLNHAKNEPQQVDHNHNTKVSQNRGENSQTCVHYYSARCPSVAADWMRPNYMCPGHVSAFCPPVHPLPAGPPCQIERIDTVPRASFCPAGPTINPQNYPVIYYPFHLAPPQ